MNVRSLVPETPSTKVLLLVEDNPADADYVQELLDSRQGDYEVIHVADLAHAVEYLNADEEPDVILLDLRLPDASGTSAVESVKRAAGTVPIVVLTGTDDEQMALDCIDSGAQDYVCKSELKANVLRRAIGYAITRRREAQVRELEETLFRYRSMVERGTEITAALSGIGSVRERMPEHFFKLVKHYRNTFDKYVTDVAKPRLSMETVATRLGDAGAGPRDLIELHVEALDQLLFVRKDRSAPYVVEGRLLALEMMGLLVEYYRVGNRRHDPSWEDPP